MTTIRHLTGRGVQPDSSVSGDDTATMSSGRLGCFTRIVATWHVAVNFLVPIGYEDETGFHYGELLARNSHAGLKPY